AVSRFRFFIFVSALVLALAGCAAKRPPAPPPLAYKTGAACMAQLGELQVGFTPTVVTAPSKACAVPDPLRVSTAGTIDWGRQALVSCSLAATMASFSREVIQPEAVRHFGAVVVRIHHLGTWSCRRRNNSTFGRISQHAAGKAIDIAAFELSDGRRI